MQEKRNTRQQEPRYQSLDTRQRYQCLDARHMSASATLQTYTTLHLDLQCSEGGKRAGMVRGSPRAPYSRSVVTWWSNCQGRLYRAKRFADM